jgi:uncharacterized protein with WD repeat
MGRSSASHGKKPARKLPRKQWQTDESKAALEQGKVFREKAVRTSQKNRTVDTSMPLKRKLGEQQKRVRALNKKLREIEGLQRKAKLGEELDEQQIHKLDALGAILHELTDLGALGAPEDADGR